MSLQNLYHKRLAAKSSSCTICFSPTTTVLTTPDSRDWFYVCPSHLKNSNYATPVDDASTSKDAPITDEELQKEIEAVKKEYAEKLKKRSKKKKDGKKKEEKKDGKKVKDDDDDGLLDQDDKNDEEERDVKIRSLEEKQKEAKEKEKKDGEEGPRIFTLNRQTFNSRVAKLQAAAMAKKRQEQFKNPGFFPAVPKGGLG